MDVIILSPKAQQMCIKLFVININAVNFYFLFLFLGGLEPEVCVCAGGV